MDKIVVYELDGKVHVLHPAPQARMENEGETAFLTRVIKKDVPPAATNVSIRLLSEKPTDRTFREAWNHDLSVDMGKAREIHRDRMRQLRQPMLSALDVEYMRADEAGDAAQKLEIIKRKQQLRDVTKHPAIESASTPDDLKQATIDVLMP